MQTQMPEHNFDFSPCCDERLSRPVPGEGPWFCMCCGKAYDPSTGELWAKQCLGCTARLAFSDSDICGHCDDHGVIVVNGKAYMPI